MNEKRISLLKSFIEEEPDNPFNHYALTMEYYQEEASRALTLLIRLTEEFPAYLPTYFKLAHLQWENEQWELAEATFLKGIALAKEQQEQKALSELTSAYQNFQFEKD